MTDVTPPPAPEQTPAWEDLLNILISPVDVFKRRMADPTFAVPLVILTVALAVLFMASWDITDQLRVADGTRQIETVIRNNPNLPAESVEKMRAGVGGGDLGRYLGGLAVPVFAIFVGLYTWIAAKLVGARTTMGQSFMIATFAFTPKIIGLIIGIVLAVTLPDSMLDGQFRLTLGPGLLIDPDTIRGSYLFALSRLELTTLWCTLLIALGIKTTGEISGGKAFAAGVMVWILGGLLPIGGMMVGEIAQGVK